MICVSCSAPTLYLVLAVDDSSGTAAPPPCPIAQARTTRRLTADILDARDLFGDSPRDDAAVRASRETCPLATYDLHPTSSTRR